MSGILGGFTAAVLLPLVTLTITADAKAGQGPSQTIRSALFKPLPPEELTLSTNTSGFIVDGPTFAYGIERATGAINALRVVHEGEEVISSTRPADIHVDQYHLASSLNSCELTVLSQGKDKIVLQARGVLRDPAQHGPELDYSLLHTFFNDGVVVTEVKLMPRSDFQVTNAIFCEFSARGPFSNYIHKRRDEHGDGAARGGLPEVGQTVRLNTLTSCLGLFNSKAALAIFTDVGATHLSRTNLDSAVIQVAEKSRGVVHASMRQYIVHVVAGDKPYLLKAGEEFKFRTGISLAPNRVPHQRMHDFRVFTWIGDAKFPYPSDEELAQVAQWGFTVFQMHRLGTPGEPRPPAGELERVINKVHELGMLFLWTENADLLYDSASGVQALKAQNKWPLWQGFNYGGRYTAEMDPFCALVATCLSSPNGLAEYRLATIGRMMERFAVDGIYLDDNLAYSNCSLWREHGHPRPVYDCLIELHEMNWRRRQLLLSKCPHALLISHCTRAFILPVICDFDAQLFGEGYSFGPPADYWNNYIGAIRNLPAQGLIWPGDDEGQRCAAALAYNYDLLTGGGQYTQIDWRLFAKKFPYAAGVSKLEPLLVRTYNLAQYYFGLYESKSFSFADYSKLFGATTPETYASVYHNKVWDDWLIPVANMSLKAQKTTLKLHSPESLGINPGRDYAVFNVHQRRATVCKGSKLEDTLSEIEVAAQSLQLYCLRQAPDNALFHLWGGKRISEAWDGEARKLVLTIQGPAGLRDAVFIGGARQGIQQVLVAGKPAPFFIDSTQGLAHGMVTFTRDPLRLEVLGSANGTSKLPEEAVLPDPVLDAR